MEIKSTTASCLLTRNPVLIGPVDTLTGAVLPLCTHSAPSGAYFPFSGNSAENQNEVKKEEELGSGHSPPLHWNCKMQCFQAAHLKGENLSFVSFR